MRILNKLLTVLFISACVSQAAYSATDLLNFEVDEKGVYQVSHADLLDAGLDLSGEPIANLALINQGQPVWLEIVGSDANPLEFGAGARVRFIGKGLKTLYTSSNVYTLKLDASQQRLIQSESIQLPARAAYANSYLASKSFAPQNEYTFASPDPLEPWYAKRITAIRKSARETVQIDLPDYLPGGNTGSTTAKMKANVWGATNLLGSNPDHHVKIDFNGQTLIDETFDGFVKKELTASVSNLTQGVNQVSVTLPLDHGYDYDVVNLDSITVNYPRAFVAEEERLNFDSSFSKFLIRGFENPNIVIYREPTDSGVTRLDQAQVAGRCASANGLCAVRFGGAGGFSSYYAVSEQGVLSPTISLLPVPQEIKAGNAEYLIITHADFIAGQGETDLLGRLTNDLGSQFSSVDVVNVDQIYAQFGNHIFDPQAIKDYIKYAADYRATRYVLLVGGDIYDYHGYQNSDARSFIPSIYMSIGSMMNFAPVDAKYADLDGDDTPDLAIGRLPVRTMGELQVLLDKRDAYLNRSYLKTAVFAADKFDDLHQYSFKQDALSVQQQYFPNWNVTQAMLDDVSPGVARASIVGAINNGVSLTSFFGHSSTSQWSFSGLFTGFDAANLSNSGRPTVVTQWGCWNTYYVNPSEDSMGHRFMMEGAQGAVGVMGATTLTNARNEKELALKFYKYLDQGNTLGEAMMNAKTEFAQVDPGALDVILGWTLLGFPELIP